MLLPGSQDWMLQSGVAVEALTRSTGLFGSPVRARNQSEGAIAAERGISGTVGCGGNLPIAAGALLVAEAVRRSRGGDV